MEGSVFMSIFSNKNEKKTDKNSAPENLQWHQQIAAEEQQEVEENMYAQTGNIHTPLAGLQQELKNSKKGSGWSKGNSSYYNDVSDKLSFVLNFMNHPLTENIQSIQVKFNKTQKAYQQLIKACHSYLKRRSSSTQGKARQEIVGRILEQAEADVITLSTYLGQHFLLSESDRAATVGEALQIARRKKLEMKKSDDEYKHVGGAASRLTILKEGDLKDSDASGYFKEEDIFTFHEASKFKSLLFELMERAKKGTKISKSLYKKVCNYIDKEVSAEGEDCVPAMAGKLDDFRGVPKSEEAEYAKFVKRVKEMSSNWETTYRQMTDGLNMNLKEGDTVHLSNRNVATSRVAEALGIGNLIAKSETVEMQEPGQKKGRVGNFMKEAKGREAIEIERNEKSADARAQRVTGDFQNQMASLQVLDFLTGQVDRHKKNYLVQEDENGMFTGVTGIDNDYSFGNGKIVNNSNGTATIGTHGRSVVDTDGNLIIPHMDKKLANCILALTEEQLTYMLIDLLEPKAIEYACQRLSMLKNAISEEMKRKESKVFLSDGEWNEDTLNRFRSAGNGCGTYLGILVNGKYK